MCYYAEKRTSRWYSIDTFRLLLQIPLKLMKYQMCECCWSCLVVVNWCRQRWPRCKVSAPYCCGLQVVISDQWSCGDRVDVMIVVTVPLVWVAWDDTRIGYKLLMKNTHDQFRAQFDVTLTRADTCRHVLFTYAHIFSSGGVYLSPYKCLAHNLADVPCTSLRTSCQGDGNDLTSSRYTGDFEPLNKLHYPEWYLTDTIYFPVG